MTEPKLPKACRTGAHLFSEYVETVEREGVEIIVARCPLCRETAEFPVMAKYRWP